MSEHTKEPWTLAYSDDDPYGPIKVCGKYGAIAKLWLDDAPVPDFNAQQQANGDRIVACVNACAGIPTADLATGVVPAEVVRRLVEATTLLVEADCDYMRINHLGDPEKQHRIKLARAAIAAAESMIQGAEK
jgi:hypothetical protein